MQLLLIVAKAVRWVRINSATLLMPISCLSFIWRKQKNEELMHAYGLRKENSALLHIYAHREGESSQAAVCESLLKLSCSVSYVHTGSSYSFCFLPSNQTNHMNHEPVRCWRKTKKYTISNQGHESGNVNHIMAWHTCSFLFCRDVRDSSKNGTAGSWVASRLLKTMFAAP